MVCGTSWFPVSELSQRLKQKSVKNPITKMNEYQREYQQICKQTPRFTIGDCAGGHRADNREKNRDVLVVPRKFPPIKHRINVFPVNEKRKETLLLHCKNCMSRIYGYCVETLYFISLSTFVSFSETIRGILINRYEFVTRIIRRFQT